MIEEDPADPRLLFLGTEFGLFVSQDGGANWWRFSHGLPTVSVMDLAVHPREHDLVIATHGRSLFIVDDISPLRAANPEVTTKPLHLFDIPPAQQYRVRQGSGARFAGDTEFRGENRPYGALISFWVTDSKLPHPDPEVERTRQEALPQPSPTPSADRAAPTGRRRDSDGPQATISVADQTGTVVRTFTAPVTQGFNRVSWDLRRDAFKDPPRGEESWWQEGGGPELPPGRYTVTVQVGEQRAGAPVEVMPDPRVSIAPADRQAKWQAIQRAGALQEQLSDGITRLRAVRDDLAVVRGKLRRNGEGDNHTTPDEARKRLLAQADALDKRVGELEKLFWVPPGTKGIVDLGDARSKVRRVLGALQSSWEAPTAAQLAYLQEAEISAHGAMTALHDFVASEVTAFRTAVSAAGVGLFSTPVDLAQEGTLPLGER